MTTPLASFTIKLPVAADELGRWLEAHGASISICCMLGTYHVTVGRNWKVSRYNRDLTVALEDALRAAGVLAP